MCGSITRSPLHSAARGRLVSLTHTPENVRSSVIILVSVYKCDKGKECVMISSNLLLMSDHTVVLYEFFLYTCVRK